MSSRDIVRETLTFDSPERVARSFHDSDFVSARPSVDSHATDWSLIGPSQWVRVDEWGNTWARIVPYIKRRSGARGSR